MGSSTKITIAVGAVLALGIAIILLLPGPLGAVMFMAAGALAIVYIHRNLSAYDELTDAVEKLAAGDLSQPRLTVRSTSNVGRMATAVNQLLTQLRLLSEEALELANGEIGVQALQDRVLETGQLSVVDLPSSSSQGDLNRSFAQLTNQLRRLTVKAHIIANDQLYNPALDERLPGELGDAFGMMVQNLRTLAERARHIAGGDLTSQVEKDGDLNRVFNEMVVSLRTLVEEIVGSALHVATSTEEMMHVLHHYEDSARQQALRIQKTLATVERLFESSDAIADNARHVFEAAEETRETNRKITRRIEELNQHSQRISEILNLIKNIAERSDLLALNASLEGFRAGEKGRGFTLVANEMRRLAENTTDSVSQIKGLVTDIQASAETTVQACQEGLERSEGTTQMAMKIKVVTGTQRENTGEVNEAMEELSQMLHQGVAGIRQVTVAAAELASLSESLRDVTARFEVGANQSWQHRAQDPIETDDSWDAAE